MKRVAVVLQGALWAFLLWLYLGDLVVLARVASAPVAALGALPSLPVALVGGALALAGAGLFAWARVKAAPPRWRVSRLVLAGALGLLFVDLVVLSSREVGLSADAQLVLAVQGLANELADAAVPEGVPRDPALLEDALAKLPRPPLYVSGQRLDRWQVQLRERCAGPATEPSGALPGTFVYCVDGARQRAWVSLVALPRGEHFGAAALLGAEAPAVGEVVAPPPFAPEAPGVLLPGESAPPDEAPPGPGTE